MKTTTYPIAVTLFISFMLIFLGACGDGEQAPEEETPQMEEETATEVQDPILTMELGSVDKIEDWVSLIAIKLNEEAFPIAGPVMINRNDKEYEAIVVNPDGRVQIVRLANPDWENLEEGLRYFTRDGDVILLEELQKTADGVKINTIYYADGVMLNGRSRMGATIEEARKAVSQPYEATEADDLRLKYEEVKARSEALINEVKTKAGG